MKIKVKSLPYAEVCKLPKPEHKLPMRSLFPLRVLMKLLGKLDLKQTHFSAQFIGISDFPDEPYLLLMNHSCFLDLEIVSSLLFPKPFAIVCTSDGFVGKEGLMRRLGCIPTNKFVTDPGLLGDISYALHRNRTPVLMYPEASYSFDGRATALPQHFGVALKRLKVPVVMITTKGAFTRDPLYNMLQKRQVDVSAEIRLLFSKEDLHEKSTAELDAALAEAFSFDAFAWQKENRVEINEPFRADSLERILFRCTACNTEGQMFGKGTTLTCRACGETQTLSPLGELLGARIPHIPDWFAWEREQVRAELQAGTYRMDFDCRILVFRDFKAVYDIGRGHLTQDEHGFTLTGADGALSYTQSATASYGLYADYYWYELGDVICIGNNEMLYYCLPDAADRIPVAKARMAAEELFKLHRRRRNREPAEV